MSDYEIAALTNEFLNSLQGRIDTYLTGLFAMLITSYFVASKLSRAIAGLVICLFSLYSFVLGYAAYTSLWRVGVLVQEFSSTSSDPFPWILVLPGFDPALVMAAVLVAAYCGAIWFFFYSRRNPIDTPF